MGGVSRVTIWVLGIINLLTKSPDPPDKVHRLGFGLRHEEICLASLGYR